MHIIVLHQFQLKVFHDFQIFKTGFFGRETTDSLVAALDRLDTKADEEGINIDKTRFLP